MTKKYTLKQYLPKMHYHAYNRGARQEVIFHDRNDFVTFKRILRQEENKRSAQLILKAFCILPNHFHLLIYQEKERAIISYMTSISMRYTHYYRRKYYHHGRLFESAYKAILLPKEKDVGRVLNYILSNPTKAGLKRWSYVGRERL